MSNGETINGKAITAAIQEHVKLTLVLTRPEAEFLFETVDRGFRTHALENSELSEEVTRERAALLKIMAQLAQVLTTAQPALFGVSSGNCELSSNKIRVQPGFETDSQAVDEHYVDRYDHSRDNRPQGDIRPFQDPMTIQKIEREETIWSAHEAGDDNWHISAIERELDEMRYQMEEKRQQNTSP